MERVSYHKHLPRKFHAYNIGTGKSGTHSISGIFQSNYRAAHEPEHYLFIQWLLENNISYYSEIGEAYVRQRDNELNLELEASGLLSFLVKALVKTFPQAKFILTIRDCYSWLDSCINHQLNARRTQEVNFWWEYRDFCFRPALFEHCSQASVLADYNLYPLEGYLWHWQQINESILRGVPSENLLIVRTADIANSIERIADFLAIPLATLNPSASHLFKAKKKFYLMREIDRSFLDEKVSLYCKQIMDQYFPNIKELEDALS